VETCRYITKYRPHHNIALAVDNTAATAWINQRYCGVKSNDLIIDMVNIMGSHRVVAVDVRTDQQPADGPSRNSAPNTDHVKKGYALIRHAVKAL
jgi:hypothetical protein